MTKETSSCDPTNRRVKGELTTISETINLTMDNLRSVRPTMDNLSQSASKLTIQVHSVNLWTSSGQSVSTVDSFRSVPHMDNSL